MNFLAHLYLSGSDSKIQLGNFMGDFVRGRNLREQFEPSIALGIELHRSIDAFTDKHPTVKRSKDRLRPKYRHFAPVIIDMFYDHFLARHWNRFHPSFLPDYAESAYNMILSHEPILPDQLKWMMPYMVKQDWLSNYARMEGLGKALNGMARRTPYDSKMNEAVEELTTFYQDFETEFFEFFPQLESHSKDFLAGQGVSPT